jgi:hypothetical protein
MLLWRLGTSIRRLRARAARLLHPITAVRPLPGNEKMNQMRSDSRFRIGRGAAAGLLLVLILGTLVVVRGRQTAPPPKQAGPIPIAEFNRIIREFSEEGGYFRADNFTSNESAYLHVTGEFRRLGVTGGAYLGVGPEQNFTYIAKIRPQIAFIVDIRRQAVIQHLLYKAILHHAKDRAEFLSWLFSKPLPSDRTGATDSLEGLLDSIASTPSTREIFTANLFILRKTIEHTFQFPLSAEDADGLEYIYYFFWRANLRISYGPGFPSLRNLILQTDLQGERGNFLAHDADYEFVRRLQEQNRVIPIVGDFAGPKALAAVASYLRQNRYTTTAFYVSNVEEYLYQDGLFSRFAFNVGKLPISDRTVFIRSLRPGWTGSHPANVRRDDRMSLLQKVSVFLKYYKEGAYPDYWKLVTTHYIAGTPPSRTTNPSK